MLESPLLSGGQRRKDNLSSCSKGNVVTENKVMIVLLSKNTQIFISPVKSVWSIVRSILAFGCSLTKLDYSEFFFPHIKL